jgi:hypothetical protein
MDNNKIRYNVTTYTKFSHNHVIGLLSSNDADYRYTEYPTEETYSRFEVVSNRNAFETIREASKENNGASFTLEYGAY